jgi:hypothetical protein
VGLMIVFEEVHVQGEASYFVADFHHIDYAHLVEGDVIDTDYYPRMYYRLNSDVRSWLNDNCPGWCEDSVNEGLELALVSNNDAFMFTMRWS